MKKLLLVASLLCATAVLVQAEDAAPAKKAKKEMTAEQKQIQADMLAKYDTNKDGKLDKDERAAISQEDKEKMAKAGLGGKKKKDAEAEAPKAETEK